MSREKEDKTSVTIRGIDKDLYNRLSVLARETGKTIGELINESMRLMLSFTDNLGRKLTSFSEAFREGLREARDKYLEIGLLDELVVTRRDLEEVDKPVVFKNIKRLIISDDVPYELFEEKISEIIMCKEVIVPENYPKLKVARKIRFGGKIISKKH